MDAPRRQIRDIVAKLQLNPDFRMRSQKDRQLGHNTPSRERGYPHPPGGRLQRRIPAEFEPYFIAEQKAVWNAYRDGHLRECYFQTSPPEVTLIYEAAEAAAVHEELDRLPMVKAGLLNRRVVHLGPWLSIETVFDMTVMAPR